MSIPTIARKVAGEFLTAAGWTWAVDGRPLGMTVLSYVMLRFGLDLVYVKRGAE